MVSRIVFILILECIEQSISRQGKCDLSYKGCCQGTFWNEALQRCIDCYPGYFKANCSTKCPYPYFGHLCDFVCNCAENECDFARGCVYKQGLSTAKADTKIPTKHFTRAYVISTGMRNASIVYDNSNDGMKLSTVAVGCTMLVILVLSLVTCVILWRKQLFKKLSKGKKLSIYDDVGAINNTKRLYDSLGPESIYEGSGEISIAYSYQDEAYVIKIKTNPTVFDSTSRPSNAMQTRTTTSYSMYNDSDDQENETGLSISKIGNQYESIQ